jgi:pectinesterase
VCGARVQYPLPLSAHPAHLPPPPFPSPRAAWFGGSSTVIEASTIEMTETVTAARGEPGSAYLLLDSAVTTPPGGTVLLGRPWGQYTTTVLKNCSLGAGVQALGWSDWQHGCTSARPGSPTWCDPVLYAEFNSTGPGADPRGRPWWTHQLTPAQAGAWTRAGVLRGWDPSAGSATR